MGNGGAENGRGKRGRICPACGATLATVEREGIEIDRCPGCRGIWLDRGELEKLVAHDEDHDGRAAFERSADEGGKVPDPADRLATRRSFFAELFDVE